MLHRCRIAGIAAGLFFAMRAAAWAAGDWRPALTRAFSSLDVSRSAALTALKPLWEKAPSLGAHWALSQSEPIIQELEVGRNLTPADFEALAQEDRQRLLEAIAENVASQACRRASAALGDLDGDFSRSDLIARKEELLSVQRLGVYLVPEQVERLARASQRVNSKLWDERSQTGGDSGVDSAAKLLRERLFRRNAP